MNFEKRLERAITRGQRTRDVRGREQAEREMSEEELKNLHSKCRLELSEHIESCLQTVGDRFPGFDFQTVISDGGWGAKLSRDDIGVSAGRRSRNLYSRLEMVVRPFTPSHLVELTAKATIRNKELFNRSHYQLLSQLDIDSFCELIDLWVLEFAEQYCAQDSLP